MEIPAVQEAAVGVMVAAAAAAQAHPAKVIRAVAGMTVVVTTAEAEAARLETAKMLELMRVMEARVQHRYYQVLQ
jgi:hypothetical protein